MRLKNCDFLLLLLSIFPPLPLLFWHKSCCLVGSHLGLSAQEMAFGLSLAALSNGQEGSNISLSYCLRNRSAVSAAEAHAAAAAVSNAVLGSIASAPLPSCGGCLCDGYRALALGNRFIGSVGLFIWGGAGGLDPFRKCELTARLREAACDTAVVFNLRWVQAVISHLKMSRRTPPPRLQA